MQFSAGERYTKQAGNGDGEMTKNALPPPLDRCSTGFTGPKLVRSSRRVFRARFTPDIVGTRSTKVLLQVAKCEGCRTHA